MSGNKLRVDTKFQISVGILYVYESTIEIIGEITAYTVSGRYIWTTKCSAVCNIKIQLDKKSECKKQKSKTTMKIEYRTLEKQDFVRTQIHSQFHFGVLAPEVPNMYTVSHCLLNHDMY